MEFGLSSYECLLRKFDNLQENNCHGNPPFGSYFNFVLFKD